MNDDLSNFDPFKNLDGLQRRLFDSVIRRDRHQIAKCLELGAKPNIPTPAGSTLLLIAADMNDSHTIHHLISYGADVHSVDSFGSSALHLSENLESTILLIAHGASVNAKDHMGRTPMHYAHDPVMIELLVVYGADVNITDNNGLTPLHHAACCGELNAVIALVSHGADSNIRDNRGRNVAVYAEDCGCEDVVQYLSKRQFK